MFVYSIMQAVTNYWQDVFFVEPATRTYVLTAEKAPSQLHALTPLCALHAQGLFATVISCAACILIPGQFVMPHSWQQVLLLVATGATACLTTSHISLFKSVFHVKQLYVRISLITFVQV